MKGKMEAASLTNDASKSFGLAQLRMAAESVEATAGIGNVEGKSDTDKFTEEELVEIGYKVSKSSIKKGNLIKILEKVMKNPYPFYVQNDGWGEAYYKCHPNPSKVDDTIYSVTFFNGEVHNINFNDKSTKFSYYLN